MKRLSDRDSLAIAKLVSTFRGEVTWADVVDLAEEVTGRRYTRQSLEKKDEIKVAYTLANGKDDGGRRSNKKTKPKSQEVRALEARLERVLAEKKMLEAVIAEMREQFVVWSLNAVRNGMTEAELNRPLTKVYRKATEE